jgi:membrane-associated HD superfamily phosphohydrolase
MQNRPNFTFTSFLLRYLAALILVFVTYNPSEYCWVQWLNSDTVMVYKVASGIVLLIGWIMFLRATWNSLGAFGTLLAAAFFAVMIWLLIEWGLLALDSTSIMVWVVEFILSGVLAVGMSWSHIRRKISGQYDTDEIEG